MKKPKIIVVLGPTASGKTSLGAAICRKVNGEIISADSRQIYKGLDIGTGKERLDMKQHLIDIVEPEERYTVAQWKESAEKIIADLIKKNKVPVVVGGTSLYVEALIENYHFAPEDLLRRKKLEKKSVAELVKILSKIDQEIVLKIDKNNRRYLVRAIERAEQTGQVKAKKGPQKFDCLLLAPKIEREELYKRIDQRVDDRLKEGMIEEVRSLLDKGVSSEWLIGLGLEYKHLTKYLLGEITKDEAIEKLKFDIHRFARKQLIWWRRRKNIHYIKNREDAIKLSVHHLAD